MAVSDYDLVIVHMMRRSEILDQAMAAGLTEDDLKGVFAHYGIVFGSIADHYRKHGQIITRMILEREIELRLRQLPMVTDHMENSLKSLVMLAWGVPDEELVPDYIVNAGLLQRFIDEVKLKPKVQALTQATAEDVAARLKESHKAYEETRVSAVQSADLFSVEGRRRHTNEAQPILTGVKFIDAVTNGGLRPSSLIGILAESSGGKTMIGTQLLCEQVIAVNPRKSIGFYYEQSLEGDIAERFYSYLSEMARAEMKGKTSDEWPDKYKQKLDKLEPHLKKFLQVMDMSGASHGQGNGGPDEIEAYILRLTRLGQKPEFIVIDWLDPMVTKYFNLPKNVRLEDHREKINHVITRLKEIKDRHKLTIVVLHQIAPAVIKDKSPSYQPDWTVAAECKSFGFLMDYVFTFGRKCEKTQCMWFNSPKARGAPKDHRIVQMDAEYNRIIDVHTQFSVFSGNKKNMEEYGYFEKRNRTADGSIPTGGTL